ncbi:MAG TPA: hypothetical protein VK983_01670 [Candidatus Limnocylindrales bacterium]|nr:hypothetical protein [Candidatus Limnocylindrales bacterium]
MKLRQNQAGSAAMIAVVLVALTVIGLVGYKVMSASKTDSAKASTTTAASDNLNTQKASDLRANLVTLGVEHMILTNKAVDDALDGGKAAKESGAALYANGDAIGAAVGSVYGAEAEKTFNTVWKIHLDEFVNYAVASSKGDAAGKAKALETIDTQYTKPLSAYLAKANPNLPEATLNAVLSDHVKMTAKMIDAHTAGNYKAEYEELNHANRHMKDIMSTLAGGIVKQYPEKFQD